MTVLDVIVASGHIHAQINSIDKIDQGFFICGVDALKDIDRLHSLHITHILNVATSDLLSKSVDSAGGETLMEKLSPFEVKVIGAQDNARQNLSVYFDEMADFIETGRKAGGIVVHCAQGVSRSASACICYLMIKRRFTLNSAWRQVHRARNAIDPNEGFWLQLNKLEASLKSSKVPLQELTDEELFDDLDFNLGSPKVCAGSVWSRFNESADTAQPSPPPVARTFTFITAEVVLLAGANVEAAVRKIQYGPATHGIIWKNAGAITNCALGVGAELETSSSAPPMSRSYSTNDARLELALQATLGMDVIQSVQVKRKLAVGAQVFVGGSAGGGRKAILVKFDPDDRGGTWNVKYEDGTDEDVEACYLTRLSNGFWRCLLCQKSNYTPGAQV